MPSYLETDISESKKWSKTNHNNLFPHLGKARRFPLGQTYWPKHWIKHWRSQSSCESIQMCWELQLHWEAYSCVHRALTGEKYWARRKNQNKEKPRELPNITLVSLFLQSGFCTGGWTYGGHTHCYLLLSVLLKERHKASFTAWLEQVPGQKGSPIHRSQASSPSQR